MSFDEVYDDLYDGLYNVLSDEALGVIADVCLEDLRLNRFNYKTCLFKNQEINARTFVELRNCFLIHNMPRDFYENIPFIDASVQIVNYRNNYIKTRIFDGYRGELWQLYYMIRASLSVEQKESDIEINFDELMTDSNFTFDGLIGRYYYESCACVAHDERPEYYDWMVKEFKKKGLDFRVK